MAIWSPTPGELSLAATGEPASRYGYFLRTLAAHRRIVTLASPAGRLTILDPAGKAAVPLFPHEAFARQFAASLAGEIAFLEPEVMDFDIFIATWLPGEATRETLVSVLPAAGKPGAWTTAGRLMRDLEAVGRGA